MLWSPFAIILCSTRLCILPINSLGEWYIVNPGSQLVSTVYGYTYSRSMDQPGKVANPARGQLNREIISLSPFALKNLVSRDGFGSSVPRQPAHRHTKAESGAFVRDSSRVPRRRPFIYFKPPYAIGPVPSLSGHATAYRWRALPRVRWHMASKPHGSSERMLPWQVIMDQSKCASLSHTRYWYDVGMLKVPAFMWYSMRYVIQYVQTTQ